MNSKLNCKKMDPIKNMAEIFGKMVNNYGKTLEKADDALTTKLGIILKDEEKLRFLSYLKDIVENKYRKHAPDCTDPENCTENLAYENAIYAINQRYDSYTQTIGGINNKERPAMCFFSEGQYFDAYTGLKARIIEAKKTIVLIDGYVDSNTLELFKSKEPQIKLRILTGSKSIKDDFQRACDLYNRQYKGLKTNTSEKFHDRFIILDDENFIHIGASIKDAGNKVFMFTSIDEETIKDAIRKKLKSEWADVYD